ncbi:MAG: phosphoribosylglycinamide synthetase C domain-containing protein, partial [Clostridiales bacterium]|nr:phosphoribosylglycinamide synthetase C domain-containing protein [Clostridiales bacterium]
DQGPNTGGMGAFAPSPVYTDELAKKCMQEIYLPTIRALAAEGAPFKGVLYFGLMLTSKGPLVLEYNARFGDPETQVVLPLLDADLLDICDAIIDERLAEFASCIKWHNRAAACVIMASGGYPGKYETGFEIDGLNRVSRNGNPLIFHAGTRAVEGKIITAGGRVLGVTAAGINLDAAIIEAYKAVEGISFKNARYRRDIGRK